MAKPENPEPQKPATPPPPEPKKEKRTKPKIEVPPVVDLVISFSRSVVLLISILVALVSINSGCDLQTIFVRFLASLIVSGMVLWLVTWLFTQQYFDSFITQPKKNSETTDDNLMKDVKA